VSHGHAVLGDPAGWRFVPLVCPLVVMLCGVKSSATGQLHVVSLLVVMLCGVKSSATGQLHVVSRPTSETAASGLRRLPLACVRPI
jgi:hypothetical protein